jgi:hypothetical protein
MGRRYRRSRARPLAARIAVAVFLSGVVLAAGWGRPWWLVALLVGLWWALLVIVCIR